MIYDVIVLGGGPGGYHAALEATKNQLKTVLIEQDFIGGTCLKEGCIPTKILLKSAEVYEMVKSAETFGVSANNITYNHQITIQRKNGLIQQLNKGVISKLKKANVEIVQGFGEIVGKEAGNINVSCNGEIYVAKQLIISTGSRPNLPPIQGLDEAIAEHFALNSTQLLDEIELPEKLVIVGGGVIGIEIAEVFNKLGSEVEIIEFQQTIGGPIDNDLAVALQTMLEQCGIKVITTAQVKKINRAAIEYIQYGKATVTTASKVLISTGRVGNITAIGLESLGIEVDRGFIKTNEKCATNIPNIYAIGDVNGKSMLAHTAYREAEVAIQCVLGNKERMNYDAIPSVIYTSPEVASVGFTSAQAEAKGLEVKEITVPLYYSGRFLIEESYQSSFIKVLIDQRFKTIVGVHLLAPFASEIIFGMTLIVEQQMRIEDLKRVVIPHPSIAEILNEVVTIYENEGIFV